jgi:hypothetical protein
VTGGDRGPKFAAVPADAVRGATVASRRSCPRKRVLYGGRPDLIARPRKRVLYGCRPE